MKIGDKVVIKGEKNLWTVEEVFLDGNVSIKSVLTDFKMSCNPSSLEVVIPEDTKAAVEEECHYCGDNCPDEPDDSENLCDGFAGDIDGLYAEEVK